MSIKRGVGTTTEEISGLELITYLYPAGRGYGEAVQPIQFGRWNGGVPFRCEQKFNSEPRQCWGKADREGSGEGWLYDPLLGGPIITKILHTCLNAPAA